MDVTKTVNGFATVENDKGRVLLDVECGSYTPREMRALAFALLEVASIAEKEAFIPDDTLTDDAFLRSRGWTLRRDGRWLQGNNPRDTLNKFIPFTTEEALRIEGR